MLLVQRLNCSHAWLIHWFLQFRGRLNLLIRSEVILISWYPIKKGFGHLIQFWSQYYMFSYKGICFKCLLKHLKHTLVQPYSSASESFAHPVQNASCVISYPSSASSFLYGWNVTTTHCKCNRLTFLPLWVNLPLPSSIFHWSVGIAEHVASRMREHVIRLDGTWYELQRLSLRQNCFTDS